MRKAGQALGWSAYSEIALGTLPRPATSMEQLARRAEQLAVAAEVFGVAHVTLDCESGAIERAEFEASDTVVLAALNRGSKTSFTTRCAVVVTSLPGDRASLVQDCRAAFSLARSARADTRMGMRITPTNAPTSSTHTSGSQHSASSRVTARCPMSAIRLSRFTRSS